MPGYDGALDVEDCPWGNPNEPPKLEEARRLIADAGAEGAEVTVTVSHAAGADIAPLAIARLRERFPEATVTTGAP